MNERSKQTTNKLIESLELPQDLFLGLPCLSMTGNRELYISNHRGILTYEQDIVIILAKSLQIHVKGKGLMIENFSKDELSIKGYIHSVEFN